MKGRKKASDIFRETDYAFVKMVPFLEAFPEIEDFQIEVRESSDRTWGGEERGRVYTKANPPGEFVDCTNSVCYGGGVSIGEILRLMIDQGKTEDQVSRWCRGHEGSPQGRRQHRSCMHSFGVRVTLKYKMKVGAD
jgi:hypothetical protein